MSYCRIIKIGEIEVRLTFPNKKEAEKVTEAECQKESQAFIDYVRNIKNAAQEMEIDF